MTNTEAAQIARDHLGIEYCPRASCRATWHHAHDIDPEYPTVVAQFLTADEVADAVSEGLDVYAANCFQNLFTRERSA